MNSNSVEEGAIVLRKRAALARADWADAAQTIAAAGDDAMLMGEFGNAADQDLSWRSVETSPPKP